MVCTPVQLEVFMIAVKLKNYDSDRLNILAWLVHTACNEYVHVVIFILTQ